MGKKHYSGKELILRRQQEKRQREQKERGTNNSMKYMLRKVNQIKDTVEIKRNRREGKTEW